MDEAPNASDHEGHDAAERVHHEPDVHGNDVTCGQLQREPLVEVIGERRLFRFVTEAVELDERGDGQRK